MTILSAKVENFIHIIHTTVMQDDYYI